MALNTQYSQLTLEITKNLSKDEKKKRWNFYNAECYY